MVRNNYTANVLLRPQNKGTKKSTRFPKSHIIQQIAAFIRSKGWSVSGSSPASSGNESFSDLMATIAGKPVELILGVRRLSQSQQNYKRSITTAGGIFLTVTSVQEFKEWYNSNFKF